MNDIEKFQTPFYYLHYITYIYIYTQIHTELTLVKITNITKKIFFSYLECKCCIIFQHINMSLKYH